ncbi:uncharacterized protein SRS1_16375 [Sporisorium reilianum f. sp. reilianum]|uniref:Uncharacterized protein n=1 Tax=Sporisorium reilianum f. sp. reilianum TaxID=72559 RepID=A0A2N8ULU6_9BASI|nr:uncharacterized protein SRS1_16375 [Sporisorium reilianum f. sp. reilianum]
MSAPNQNAPRMRRHKRRINDDGSHLAHAVRAFVDQQFDESSPPLERQADGANGIGPGGNSGNGAPAMGGFAGTGSDSSNGSTNTNTAATPTSTRATGGGRGNSNSNSNGNGNGGDANAQPTATATSTTPLRNLHPTPSSSSSSTPSGIQGILSDIFGPASSSTTSTPSSTFTSTTSSSTSSTPSSTSSSTRSSSSSSSTSLARTTIVPITATAVVTATPTGTLSAATASATPKSSSSSAGPIIGIVAGALVGVVVLSGLIGFLFKKYRKQDDPYESNPFDRDAFQRHSAMIPDHYESDEGHGGAAGMSPEMSEHYQQYNNFGGPHYESGISAGAAAGAMGAMAAHNETGGPRPPTMFAKHAAGVHQNQPQVGAYYKDGDFNNQMPFMPPPHSDYHAPPVAAFASNHHADQQYLDEPGFGQGHRAVSPAPQLPPLAAFGGDPYSIAGVGRGQQQPHNVANPYAHLDRSHGGAMAPGSFVPGSVVSPGGGGGQHTAGSGSVLSRGESADQRHASINAAEALAAGLAHQSSLNRSASPKHDAGMYDTAGRPGTAEGRSGTPDIPNVQQTYALPADAAGAHHATDASPSNGALRNPFDTPAHLQQQQQQQLDAHQLSVRNLVPHAGASAGQRPVSTASSLADPEDAYGGVY